ncbi:ATP-binding protein [Paucibacter sp. Y2R2-4]|uniref:sensor histidine kinase n=1 Tax=Paucibacter sp. Y2R2-4 TaxID=2893553 RepID=UPI0021E4A852|nr:ATP-binding protein [Paucibacter sp. Y2R2-4]MCV2351519.1 DUF4118 domain-containing protein [Paucibacter sp. Y2R2-4]
MQISRASSQLPLIQKLSLAALSWAAAWALMLGLDGRVALANLTLLPVLATALASLWLPLASAMVCSLLAVLAFNWRFVPPQGSLMVSGHEHLLLLLSMLSLCWITSVLMSRLRWQADRAESHAQRAEQLQRFGEALRDSASALDLAPELAAALRSLLGAEPLLALLSSDSLPARNDDSTLLWLGPTPTADQVSGLWLCLRTGQAMGPGCGRHEELAAWYLPLRGRRASFGAAYLPLPSAQQPADAGLRAHAQTLCDQLGLALERQATEQSAAQALGEASQQATRNALLAAISHDYRTPLACIMGAASALQEQDSKLSMAQRQRLIGTILDETQSLKRMTDNSLQLARLDAPGLQLRLDWESAEDIVGAVLRRVRQRYPEASKRVKARLEPGLPLLRCDALLLHQLLDNLIDNALAYGQAPGKTESGPVELLLRQMENETGQRFVVLAVRDRGPGVDPAWRDKVFEVYQRGSPGVAQESANPRGAGIGLAACRAIARAHGGSMRLRARSHGGASFECWLPVLDMPAGPGEQA